MKTTVEECYTSLTSMTRPQTKKRVRALLDRVPIDCGGEDLVPERPATGRSAFPIPVIHRPHA